MIQVTERSLPAYLSLASSDLCRGESIKVEFTDKIHKEYLDLKMKGFYPNIMCVKEGDSYFLGRVK